jgi:hypothetical protein
MSQPTLNTADGESYGLVEEAGQSVNGFHLEPRCRVCRNDVLRLKVNDLLARGSSYAMIVRALRDDNSKLDPRDRVTVDSVRNHCARHFPAQNAAKAVYREILERRAKENGVDFIDGIATAITPIAFFETMMMTGYETLVASDTTIDVNTAMSAAARLQAIIDSRSGQTDIADVFVKQNRIIEVVRSMVPESLWPELFAKLDGVTEPAERAEADDDIDEVFDPGDDDFDDD